MTRLKLFSFFLFSILLMANMHVMNIAVAENHILPQTGDPVPVIDGNITSTEWNSSATFTTSLHGDDTSIFVTTNTTHLFIGFNMSSTNFVSVNDTVPVYNSTIANYTEGYNNATHDWFALLIDSNLDKASSVNGFGTTDSPDDAIVIDRYRSGGYDAFANDSSDPFVPDTDITYTGPLNDTTLLGNNGSDFTSVARNVTDGQVIYEVIKPIDSADMNGYDYMLSDLGVLQFKLLRWTGSVANDTLTTGTGSAEESNWFSLRVEDDGVGEVIQGADETTLQVILNGADQSDIDALATFTSLYDFNVEVQSGVANATFDDIDLTIVLVGEDSILTAGEIETLLSAVRGGDNVLFMLGDNDASSDIAEGLELQFLSNSVVMNLNVNESSSDVMVTELTSTLKLTDQASAVTSQNVSELVFQSHALNTSELGDANRFVLGQEYLSYELFTTPAGFVYDESGDGFANDTESLEGLSLGIALDLLKGGRVAVIPSSTMPLDGELTNADNAVFLLRLLPWMAQMMDTLEINGTSIAKNEMNIGESVKVSANMTDTLGNTLSNAMVMAEVVLGGNVIKTVMLTQVGNSAVFEGDLSIDENGFMEIEITGYVEGFGF
ncbi:MAG: hypothetical protein ACXAE3_17740, partial [Candidatus Kariarchaeaceae archaeon]